METVRSPKQLNNLTFNVVLVLNFEKAGWLHAGKLSWAVDLYRKLYSVVLTKYRSSDQVKKTEMGGTCGTYGGGERCIQGFGGKT